MRYQAALRPDRSAAPPMRPGRDRAYRQGGAPWQAALRKLAVAACRRCASRRMSNGRGVGALLSAGIAASRAQFRRFVAGVRSNGCTYQAMNSAILPLFSAAANAGQAPPVWLQYLPFVAMFAIFWFLIIRPQMKRQKELQAKIGGIKKGDQVLTGGGLLGKVIKVDEQYAEIELAPNVRVKALKSTIVDIVPPGGNAPAND